MQRYWRQGLASVSLAVVVLPHSLAFGVALLGVLEPSRGVAAAAGMLAAIMLNLGLGLGAGARGVVAAPAGPTTVLAAGALSGLLSQGVAAADLPVALALMLVLGGLMQILIGIVGGGRLAQFVPYPVVAGFMTGAGLNVAIAQVKYLLPQLGEVRVLPLALAPRDAVPRALEQPAIIALPAAGQAPVRVAESTGPGLQGLWEALGTLTEPGALVAAIPLAVALFTALAAEWLPRRLPRLPGALSGVLAGALCYHLLAAIVPGPLPGYWMLGPLPGLDSLRMLMPERIDSHLPWMELMGAAAAYALLSGLNTLMVALVADGVTGERHSARRTLVGLGLGQIGSGLLGGIGGTGSTGPTLTGAASQPGPRLALGVAAVLALMLVLGSRLGDWLPLCVLAGLLLHTAWKMVAWRALGWLRQPRTRRDALIVVTVTAVTVLLDLVTAVAVGVLIALALFVQAQVRAPVVHRRSDARQRRSARARPAAERAILDARGGEIVLFELRGSLFFAKADRLYRELAGEIERGACVILHLRRVQQIDLTALHILRQIGCALSRRGGELVVCELHAGLGLGHDMAQALERAAPGQPPLPVATFVGADEALEYAEDRLLTRAGCPPVEDTQQLGLKDCELLHGLGAHTLAQLDARLGRVRLQPGEFLFRAGDADDRLLLVLTGRVDLRLASGSHHYLRLASYGPGSAFGELGFLDAGRHAGEAVARSASELRTLTVADFEHLRKTDPAAATTVLLNLGRSAGRAARWSVRELHRLAEW